MARTPLVLLTGLTTDEGKATALVDFRDEYKDKRRVVACGAAHEAEPFIKYSGTSYLDLKDKPTGTDRAKLFSSKINGQTGYSELRDCHSFFSRRSGETWVIGSELYGFEKDDKVQ
jgi:hypothetical protein